jgi:hypothetical protein
MLLWLSGPRVRRPTMLLSTVAGRLRSAGRELIRQTVGSRLGRDYGCPHWGFFSSSNLMYGWGHTGSFQILPNSLIMCRSTTRRCSGPSNQRSITVTTRHVITKVMNSAIVQTYQAKYTLCQMTQLNCILLRLGLLSIVVFNRYHGNVFTEPLPSNSHPFCFHYSGFQASWHIVFESFWSRYFLCGPCHIKYTNFSERKLGDWLFPEILVPKQKSM